MATRENDQGFTLIELLTVVAIIGVLAAVAIPQFALYRQRGFDARAQTDLRNAAEAEEYYYASNESYIGCTSATDCQSKLPSYIHSIGVHLAIRVAGAAFTATASHDNGSKTFTYDSQAGGLQ